MGNWVPESPQCRIHRLCSYMKIDHIHFFVEDAASQRDWFVQSLGWTWLKQATLPDRNLEILGHRDTLFLLSSPRRSDSPVAQYLRHHGPGVADVAVEVNDLAAVLRRLKMSDLQNSVQDISSPEDTRYPGPQTPNSAAPLCPILTQLIDLPPHRPPSAWASIIGWGSLRHTLIQRLPTQEQPAQKSLPPVSQGIDHIVLNVPTGELQAAASFYQQLFELQKQQQFNIQTDQSGLRSQVLFSPASQLYFNINEPTSVKSQIQAFLDANRGAGIQHIALHSQPLVPTITTLRQRGVPLLSVPITYYEQLQRRLRSQPAPPVPPQEWQQIVEQQILIDWQPQQPQSLLLQIFSQPIFPDHHFFFEFIERRQAVQGFGEGNFLALYQAIEAMEKGMGNVEAKLP
ncbi:4-hydroxyphenylpyruvate dioxygenase family protein [Leptothoe sp. PORK10 BA2]|uniref:4-hydroxyphenylpyruvate dioxygenase family protein n=1 Tax=Leptothoe sp. PORK10 BA2 TaxID=3110254 RepID=UPI002B21D3A9|nr:VOC family protein [Leptothoe sp. PORK10 BA2]MEA5465863.1 VOC family protein [Leptothoe sp. PORK10 BA2]